MSTWLLLWTLVWAEKLTFGSSDVELRVGKVKAQLRGCKDPATADVKDRLEQSLGTTLKNNADCNCLTPVKNFSKFLETSSEPVLLSEFENLISQQIAVNTTDFYHHLTNRFDLTGVNQGKVIDRLCYGNSCSSERRAIIEQRLKELDKRPVPKANPSEILNRLNSSVEETNSGLSKIKGKVNQGYLYDSVQDTKRIHQQLENKSSRKKTSEYYESYMKAISQPDGFLLLTPNLNSIVGGLRRWDKDYTKSPDGKSVTYNSHHLIPKNSSTDLIARAAREAAIQVRDESMYVNLLDKTKNDIREASGFAQSSEQSLSDLSKMFQVSPLAVAQVLIRNPELSSLACKVLSRIKSKRESDKNFEKVFLIGGGVFSVASLGFAALPYLGVTAGAAAISSTLALGGVAMGSAGFALSTSEAFEASRTAQASRGAVITGNAPPDSVVEVEKSERRLREAVKNMGWAALEIATSGLSSGLTGGTRGVSSVKQGENALSVALEAAQKANQGNKEALKEVAENAPGLLAKVSEKLTQASKACGEGPCAKVDDILVDVLKEYQKIKVDYSKLDDGARISSEFAEKLRKGNWLQEDSQIVGKVLRVEKVEVGEEVYHLKVVGLSEKGSVAGGLRYSDINNELAMAKKADELGISPKLMGWTKMDDGRVAIVTKYVKGFHIDEVGENAHLITDQHYSEMKRIGDILVENGIMPDDLQFRIGTDGKVYLIDLEKYSMGPRKLVREKVDKLLDVFTGRRVQQEILKKGVSEEKSAVLFKAGGQLATPNRRKYFDLLKCLSIADVSRIGEDLVEAENSRQSIKKAAQLWLDSAPACP